MPFQVNLKKRDFVRGRMRRNPKIGGRTRASAREYYRRLYHDLPDQVRLREVNAWRGLPAVNALATPPQGHNAQQAPNAQPGANAPQPRNPPPQPPAQPTQQDTADPEGSDAQHASQADDEGTEKAPKEQRRSPVGRSGTPAQSASQAEQSANQPAPGTVDPPSQNQDEHPPVSALSSPRPDQLIRDLPSITDRDTRVNNKMKVRKLAFKKMPPFREAGLAWEPEWNPTGHYLAAGGYGTTFVCRRIANGKVIDRLVVKDCVVPPALWAKTFFWHYDASKPGGRVPMEIHALEHLSGRPGSENVIQLRGSATDNDKMWYRIYAGYCAYGELQGLISNKKLHRWTNIPEPAVWSIFDDLVKGCLLLQYGAVEEDEAEEGFRPWIHRDLKPQNVFLDDRQRTADFSMYPQGRIGDFGLAICTDEQDPDNPFAYLDAGTPYWTPPELILLHDGRTMLPIKGPKLGEKTNVWGIGAIMSRLISREPRPNRPAFEDAMPDGPGISGDAYKYSQELRDTIKLCCNYRPGQRVSLRELREEILKYTVAEPYGKVDRAEGMRSGRPEDVDEAFMLPDVEPTYTIGFQVEPEEQCQPQ